MAKLDRTKLAKPTANLSASDKDDVLEAVMEELDGQRAGVLSAKYIDLRSVTVAHDEFKFDSDEDL